MICRWPNDGGKSATGREAKWAHGVYFPDTDLFVSEMGGRSTGKPAWEGVEWFPVHDLDIDVSTAPGAEVQFLKGEHGDLAAQYKDLAARYDKLVESSVGAMQIAEGDQGWERIPIDCPTLEAVAKLRKDYDEAVANLAKAIADYKAQPPLCSDCGKRHSGDECPARDDAGYH